MIIDFLRMMSRVYGVGMNGRARDTNQTFPSAYSLSVGILNQSVLFCRLSVFSPADGLLTRWEMALLSLRLASSLVRHLPNTTAQVIRSVDVSLNTCVREVIHADIFHFALNRTVLRLYPLVIFDRTIRLKKNEASFLFHINR